MPAILIVVVLIVVVIALVVVGITRKSEGNILQERMAEFITQQETASSLEDIEMSVPFSQRVLLPLMEQLASFTQGFAPQEALEKTEKRLEIAGKAGQVSASVFWTMRIVVSIGLVLFLGFVFIVSQNLKPVMSFGITAGAGVLGFVLPPMWLSGQIKRRQDEIQKALPDALDLLTICVEAGLGFDGAMGKVAEKWDNELSLAFERVLTEIQVGKTRSDALRTMGERIDVQDVSTFTASIIQADQLGVNISNVLKIQADQMRIKRRQRAEEKAQQAPVKMVIPMVFLIFPTIYLVLLGPAGLQVFQQFNGGP